VPTQLAISDPAAQQQQRRDGRMAPRQLQEQQPQLLHDNAPTKWDGAEIVDQDDGWIGVAVAGTALLMVIVSQSRRHLPRRRMRRCRRLQPRLRRWRKVARSWRGEGGECAAAGCRDYGDQYADRQEVRHDDGRRWQLRDDDSEDGTVRGSGGVSGVCFDHARGSDYGGCSGSDGGVCDGIGFASRGTDGGCNTDCDGWRPTARRCASFHHTRTGTQALSATAGDTDLEDATAGGTNTGAELPSLGNLGDASSVGSNDSVAVSGQAGVTNPLANMSEDQLRDRVNNVMDQVRQQGGLTADQQTAVVSMLGGIMGGGGPGGGGRAVVAAAVVRVEAAEAGSGTSIRHSRTEASSTRAAIAR